MCLTFQAQITEVFHNCVIQQNPWKESVSASQLHQLLREVLMLVIFKSLLLLSCTATIRPCIHGNLGIYYAVGGTWVASVLHGQKVP